MTCLRNVCQRGIKIPRKISILHDLQCCTCKLFYFIFILILQFCCSLHSFFPLFWLKQANCKTIIICLVLPRTNNSRPRNKKVHRSVSRAALFFSAFSMLNSICSILVRMIWCKQWKKLPYFPWAYAKYNLHDNTLILFLSYLKREENRLAEMKPVKRTVQPF